MGCDFKTYSVLFTASKRFSSNLRNGVADSAQSQTWLLGSKVG